MTLKVFRNNLLVGTLDMRSGEPFYGFTYESAYLSSPEALPLSLSLPLRSSRFTGAEALPYFEGLLPEGDARDAIARRLGIPRTNPAKLLKALGQDCAGDVSVLEEGELPPSGASAYLPLEKGIARIAENPFEEIPLIQEETRLSLAGGQEKLALYHQAASFEEGWFVPVAGSPSTHILKPGVLEARYPHLTLNEFLCLRAASACGISTAEIALLYPQNPLLVVTRYDRATEEKTSDGFLNIHRIHQEDCCQACGVASDNKYERDGGPGFAAIRNLLVRHSLQPNEDITAFITLGLFNYVIGNCDAHAKNYSLLQNANGTVSFAPAYDLICTTIYDGKQGQKLSRGMGMSVGSHENIDRINTEDFERFSQDVRLSTSIIKEISENFAVTLGSAFQAAAEEAASFGFSAAEEVASRIVEDCKPRLKTLGKLKG